MTQRYTTVAKDRYGRYYDLCFEHPSWEEKKKGVLVCTVVDAFTCTVEEADRLTGNPGRAAGKNGQVVPVGGRGGL